MGKTAVAIDLTQIKAGFGIGICQVGTREAGHGSSAPVTGLIRPPARPLARHA
jgi:hypothetical protein